MDSKALPPPDDNTTAMKLARWIVWGVVIALMLWFVWELPVFHPGAQ